MRVHLPNKYYVITYIMILNLLQISLSNLFTLTYFDRKYIDR